MTLILYFLTFALFHCLKNTANIFREFFHNTILFLLSLDLDIIDLWAERNKIISNAGLIVCSCYRKQCDCFQ